MSIRENIFLGRENRKARFFVDFQKTSELAKTYTDMVGLTADVNTLVKDLSIAQRQMVEVAKALSTNAKLIVMDEPTSSLTDRETEILMNVIRNLRDQGSKPAASASSSSRTSSSRSTPSATASRSCATANASARSTRRTAPSRSSST